MSRIADEIITGQDNARALGQEHGRNAGSRVVDGCTSVATAQWLIDAEDEGNPEFYDMIPAPLSGEFAGDMTPDALILEVWASSLEVADWTHTELCVEYEEAFISEWIKTVIADARKLVEG